MSIDPHRPRPPDLRLPRPPHRRGRDHPRQRRQSPARRFPPAPPPAPTRPTNCATATQRFSTASASPPPSSTSTARSPPRCAATTLHDQRAVDAGAARTWTAPRTLSRLGANAVLGTSLAVCRASAAASRAAAVPADRPARRRRRAGAADADGQHPLRRPARRPRHGRPGLPGRPGRGHLRARGHPAHLPGPRAAAASSAPSGDCPPCWPTRAA